jgi:hypothetical protein
MMRIKHSDFYTFVQLANKLGKPSELPTEVAFLPTGNGVIIAAIGSDAAAAYTVDVQDSGKPFTLPYALVKELAAKRDGEVALSVHGNEVAVSWTINELPRIQHHHFGTVPKLPSVPETSAHTLLLLEALVDANGGGVDVDTVRPHFAPAVLTNQRETTSPDFFSRSTRAVLAVWFSSTHPSPGEKGIET